MNVTIRTDDLYVYADVFDAEPSSQLYIELRSRAVAPNESTEGVTAALHKTIKPDGTTTFRVPKDYMFPDFPREITVIGPIANEVFAS